MTDAALSDKAAAELAFWQSRIEQQGTLSNDHFEYFYTTHFGLDRNHYSGLKILDMGCGPRGSLEWASGASRRVGLDPLASAYRTLGTDRHAMEYIAGGAEDIPFPDSYFDVVSSFNSLDHVDNLDRVIAEITRVVSSPGLFLLLTDVHQHPTVLEPTAFSWDMVQKFLPAFEIAEQRHFEYSVRTPEGFGNIYGSLHEGLPFDHTDARERYGILSARFHKG